MRTEDWGGLPGSLSLSFSSKYKLHHLPLHNCLKLKHSSFLSSLLRPHFSTCSKPAISRLNFFFGQFIPLWGNTIFQAIALHHPLIRLLLAAVSPFRLLHSSMKRGFFPPSISNQYPVRLPSRELTRDSNTCQCLLEILFPWVAFALFGAASLW